MPPPFLRLPMRSSTTPLSRRLLSSRAPIHSHPHSLLCRQGPSTPPIPCRHRTYATGHAAAPSSSSSSSSSSSDHDHKHANAEGGAAHDHDDGHGHDDHYDPPGGWLWGVRPGEKYEKEGWEGIMTWFYIAPIIVATIFYVNKEDTTIQTWALEEARRRLEKEGLLTDPFPKGVPNPHTKQTGHD